jgi:hypothetical protein
MEVARDVPFHRVGSRKRVIAAIVLELLPMMALLCGAGFFAVDARTSSSSAIIGTLAVQTGLVFAVSGLGWIVTGHIGAGCLLFALRFVSVCFVALCALALLAGTPCDPPECKNTFSGLQFWPLFGAACAVAFAGPPASAILLYVVARRSSGGTQKA